MKIVLRTVTGNTTEQNVEVADTVQTIKQRMVEYDVATLRLCHKGKVLDDAKTVEELGLKEGEVLIVAGKKKAIVAAVAAQSSSTTTTTAPAPAESNSNNTPSSPAPMPVPTSTPTVQTPTTAEPTATATTTESAPAPAPTATATPDPYVDAGTVDMILMMGLTEDRAKVELALRCAYGNGDRAVDFLMNGIPPAVEAQARQAMQNPPQPPASGGNPSQPPAPAPAPGGGGEGDMTADQLGAMMAQMQEGNQGGGSDLARALAGIPQFPQIAAVVRQNPSALPEVMRQLQTNFPDVFILVQANPQEFLDIVNSDQPPGGAGGGGGGQPAPSGGAPGGPQRLVLTPEDAPAVERLVQLGGGQWDQRAAALVYLVANRNEEVAANLLFDHGGLPPELAEAAMAGGEDSDPEGSS